MKSGDRVHVKSSMYEGKATIMDIITGNIFPIQVEMDIGDEHGHKVKRFAYDQVTLEENN